MFNKFLNLKVLFIFFFVVATAFIFSTRVNAASVTTGTAGISQTQNQGFINALQSPNTTLESWVVGKELVGIPQSGMIPILTKGLTGYLWGVYKPDGTPITTGAMGTLDVLIGSFYKQQPISSSTYFQNLADNIGIGTPKAYASPGTDFLAPVLKLWGKMRDVSYVFFVIIFVAIGFMIMFRFKINPQTVATVQDALPRIVISLLLVTLSFALAGFLVDIVYVGNALITSVFQSTLTPAWIPDNKMYILDLLKSWSTFSGAGGLCSGLVCLIGSKLATSIPTLLQGSIADIIDLVVAFVIVSTLLKIFFSLLTRYVSIFLFTIFAPFAFLWGTLPGQEDTTSNLIKSFLVAVLTFPATFLFINLAQYFAYTPSLVGALNSLPPFSLGTVTGSGGAAGTSAANIANSLQALVSLGILMAAASVPQALEEALAVKAGAGGAAAEGLGGALRRLPIIGSFLG